MAREAINRLNGVAVALNESLFAKVNKHVGCHVVAIHLAWLAGGGSGWWSPFMAPPLPHFEGSYGQIS